MYAKYFVLFAILFTGWFLRRINFIDDKMNNSMNKIVVYFAYPCLIVHNIGSIEMSGKIVTNFAIAFAVSLVCFYLYGLITRLYSKARKIPDDVSNVAEFAMATPNNGFMGFPIALLFFGEQGLLLMLAHNAAMNFFMFTYGIKLMRRNNGDRPQPSPMTLFKAILKLFLNPNILALTIGFAVSLAGVTLPEPVDEYLLYLGNISTPMAMIFIGSSLVGYHVKDLFEGPLAAEASAMKLIVLPLITVGLVYFLPIDPLIKSIVVLGGAFPTAAMVSMLAQQEKQSIKTASLILILSTIASIVTVPGAINLITFLF